jgi:NAD(P)H dehydrogenase (quinone)
VKILIVVASASGRTRRMADAEAEGAGEVGAEAAIRSPGQVRDADLIEADAVIVGSGVHMGGMESSMSAFFERTANLWLQGSLVGKLGAAFASAGAGERGGAELTLISLLANLAEHGMLIVPMPNRLAGFRQAGCHWGPMVRTNPRPGTREEPGPSEADLEAARSHGRFVAECTRRWLAGAGGEISASGGA